MLLCVTCPRVFPENNDRTVCKEIRHNSTGCLRMKDQCEKCQEILEVGESGAPGLLCLQVPSTSLGLPLAGQVGGSLMPALLPSAVALGGGTGLCLALPGSPSGVEG